MEEYLSIFPDSNAHDSVKENLDFLRPHVSLLEDSGTVVYDKKKLSTMSHQNQWIYQKTKLNK